jgi:hypothetical protein
MFLLISKDLQPRFPSFLQEIAFNCESQVRLFGCAAGHGPSSIAAKLHERFQVTVYGYENSGGSPFTQDAQLGHGQRAVTPSDINSNRFKAGVDTWLVPINGTPKFRKF